MTDPVSLRERYMTSIATSSLKVKASTLYAPVDVIVAAGMVGNKHSLALRLWTYSQDPNLTDLRELRDHLSLRLEDYMQAKRMKGKAREITESVLAWWTSDACTHCQGRGFERIDNTPHLSDVACTHCRGTGKSKLQTANDAAADWLLQEISALTASAEVAINNKIK